MSEQPDPHVGETRAERRRRRLAAEAAREAATRAQVFQSVDPLAADRPRPGGDAGAGADANVGDIPREDASARPPLPRPSLRRPANLADPAPADPARNDPARNDPAPNDPAAGLPTATGTDSTGTGAPRAVSGPASPGQVDDGTYTPRSARRKPNVAPLADLAAADDPAAAAAALQLLAAQAAAARLRASTDAAKQAPQATPPKPRTASAIPSQPSGPSRTPTADALAAARVAAARAAARQQADAGNLGPKAIAATPAAGATAAPVKGRTAGAPASRATPARVPEPETRASRRHRGRSAGPSLDRLTGRPGGRNGPGTPSGSGAGLDRRSGGSWRTRAFGVAALLVIGGGTALSIPHIGALLSSVPGAAQSAAPTSPASAAPGEPTSGAPAPSGSAPAVTPACSGESIAGALKPGDAAAAVFGAQTVGDAYCYVAGVLRDHSFTDLAVRRATGHSYTAGDFAPMRAYLSADLAATYDKDVAALVASQNLASDEGRRLSALTRLAWDNGQLRFDPAATEKASKFEAGPPVTWTAKGADGIDRMGLGFETGVVTHMVDAAGRPAPYVLKRTYKLALVKGDATRPWLIDAYDVGESTAALVTVTPGTSATTPAAAATTTRR